MTDPARLICKLDELPDRTSRSFNLGAGDWPLRGFLVRDGEQVYAYVNRCPHAGHPLNWQPERFLTADRSLIICGSHGALFEIRTGTCVAGPCVGRALQQVPIAVKNGAVLLDEEPDSLLARLT